MGSKSEKAPRGRPTRYNPKTGGRIVAMIHAGASFQDAAAACGIGRRTLFDWLRSGSLEVERRAGSDLEIQVPDDVRGFEPPNVAALVEALHIARGAATVLHQMTFARHAGKDWRASYAWLRHHRPDLYGDHSLGDPMPLPKKKKKLPPATEHGTDLSTEIEAAHLRLKALRKVIAQGGSAVIPLDRAIVLEGFALSTLTKLVKAQHELNPAASKRGNFRVLVELAGGLEGFDLGPRVPNLEAGSNEGGASEKDLPPEPPPSGDSPWDEELDK